VLAGAFTRTGPREEEEEKSLSLTHIKITFHNLGPKIVTKLI
jgi:hypothetical protein